MTFFNILGSCLLSPQILLPTRITTRSKSLIDNIFSTFTDFESLSGNICHSISDHLPQFCVFKSVTATAENDTPRFRSDWSKFDEDSFLTDYHNINWETTFQDCNLDPDHSFEVFNTKMRDLLDHHIPTVKLTKRQIKSELKPWITKGLRRSISKRDFYHRKAIKAKDEHIKIHFQNLFTKYRNLIVTLCRQSKSNYFSKFFNENSKNTKKIWSGIRELISSSVNKSTKNVSLSIDGSISSNPKKVANHFNDFFSTIADKVRSEIPQSHRHFSNFLRNRNRSSIFLSPTTPEEVMKVISSFSCNKSSGPNSIPVRVLKILKNDISHPISFLINRSFETGIFPSILKVSNVIPIFKNNGSPLEVSNYRPISLLSNIEKIFEKMMYSRIIDFLNQHNQIYTRQFGFRKSHSTVHALINIAEHIRQKLDQGEFACGVFVDLQKAFDTVDHETLLAKLSYYGIRGIPNKWFRSYLSGRSQFVTVSGLKSEIKLMLHGVPQGSVLGPLLFLLYINDLHFSIRTSETYHFADDTHLLNFSKTVWSLCGRVNSDLRILVEWLKANKISLNANKTEFIIFRSPQKQLDCIPRLKLSRKTLTPSSSIKYLGVHLDEHLNWKSHVTVTSKKLQRANGVLSKLRHFMPQQSVLNVYHALFASHMRYACQVWGLCDNHITHRVAVLQNIACRLMTFSEPRTSATPLYRELGILKFFDQVKVQNTLFIHSYLSSQLPQDSLINLSFRKLNHRYGTRGNTMGLLELGNVNNY